MSLASRASVCTESVVMCRLETDLKIDVELPAGEWRYHEMSTALTFFDPH